MEIRKTVKDLVERLCQIYGKELSHQMVQTWAIAMTDISDEQLLYGLTRILREYTGSYMPTPAQFRVFATTEMGAQSLDDEAQQAWHLLVSTIARKGAYNSIFWNNTLIAEFVRKQGGWPTVCRWDEEDLTWKRKEFLAEYVVYRNSNKRFENLCIGVSDIANRQSISNGKSKQQIEFVGYKQPDIALLENKAREQFLGVSSSNVIEYDHFRKKQEQLAQNKTVSKAQQIIEKLKVEV